MLTFEQFSDEIKAKPEYAALVAEIEGYGGSESELLHQLYRLYQNEQAKNQVFTIQAYPIIEVPKIIVTNIKEPFYRRFSKRRRKK